MPDADALRATFGEAHRFYTGPSTLGSGGRAEGILRVCPGSRTMHSIPVVGDGLRRTKPGIRHERKQHSAGGARGAGGAPITREGRYVKCDNTDGRIIPVVPKSQR